MEPQVTKKHYNFQKYCYPDRWGSYYYQIKEIFASNPESVLEVGAGDETVKSYIQKALQCKYTTVDIADDLKPDIIAPIHTIPVPDNSFDTVCVFEVLEHIPFENVETALIELKRIAKNIVLISVPHFGPAVKFNIKIPFFPEFRGAFKIAFPKKHAFNGQHYWELGKKGFSPRMFKSLLSKHFKVTRDFVPYENQYHHFYILEKKS